MLDVLLDALLDSLKALPFIFIIYVLMEVLETVRSREKIEQALASGYAPVVASFTGIVPECGFSVMCAKLFDKGLIKVGTLVSAFIATSDEGLIILISDGVKFSEILLIVLIKIIFAILVGGIINIALKKFDVKHECSQNGECIECGEESKGFLHNYILHPLFHSIKIFIYLLIINIIFGFIIYFITEERFFEFVNQNYYVQPIFASIIGLIPNCASSIIIAESYIKGALSLGGLIAGLSTNAGMGIIIIFRNKKNWKSGLAILLTLFVSGIIVGYLTMLLL